MEISFENCKNCDTADDKLDYLIKQINRNITFFHKPQYTSSEVCKYLDISKKTLDNLCSNGDITYYKPSGTRYFLKEDIDAYIRRNKHRTKYRDK